MRANAVARLRIYREEVTKIEDALRSLLGERVDDRLIWVAVKALYSYLVDELADRELAETFFNSVTRRIFTVSIRPGFRQ